MPNLVYVGANFTEIWLTFTYNIFLLILNTNLHFTDREKNIGDIFLWFINMSFEFVDVNQNFEFLNADFNQNASTDPLATGRATDDSSQMEIPEPVLVLEIEFVETKPAG